MALADMFNANYQDTQSYGTDIEMGDWANPSGLTDGYNIYNQKQYSLDNLADMFSDGGVGDNRYSGSSDENVMSMINNQNATSDFRSTSPELIEYLYGLQGNSQSLKSTLQDKYGDNGLTYTFGLNPTDPTKRQTLFNDSYGKGIASKSFDTGKKSWLDKVGRVAEIAVPAIIAMGTGGAAGAVAGAAGAGTVGTGVAAGATGGYTSSAMAGQNPIKGTLAGGLTGGVAAGVSSGLQPYTTQMGNNPSAYQPGMFTPQQTSLISKGAGNIASTAARGGNLAEAIRSAAMPVAGSFVQPYVQQGMSSIGNMFNGGEQPMDDYGFNSALDNFDYGQGAVPQTNYGFGNNYVNQEQLGGVGGFDLGSMFQGGMEPQRASPQSAGGVDYSLGSSSFPASATPGFNGNANPQSAGNDWLDFFKKGGHSAGMAALQALNPQAYKALQALGLGGSQQPSALGTGVGLLASLYGSNRANKELGKQQGYLSQQQNAFGPNSAYAQQLRQQLDRKDAAGGRRSQYGPREVELQARLAEMNSRQAPALAQQQMMLSQARNQARMAPLQQLAYYGSNGGLKNLSQGLGDLFDDIQTPFGPGVIG